MTDQRRATPRTRSLLEARVVFNNRFSLLDCVVRDISETGAQIAFPHPVDIPQEFELEVPRRGLCVRARVAWSNGKNHGVMFVDAPDTQPPSLGAEAGPAPPEAPAPACADSGQPGVREALEEARHKIACSVGVPPERVRLKLELDF